ncbi:hypothetical protein LUZ63_005218 [Rhynchospora breviuscula]|uniref:Phytocyanin domain-containing protein n=1 Tax=Rhynchospora breviuscula TaxID=2022672 RepID=A0A9Q0CMN3_9POAL|nr:hypothetical protein LUZ63_005218 [Rhynchospora breviuscula]
MARMMICLVLLFAVAVHCGSTTTARAVQIFDVGESEGWVVPSEVDMYRRWASNKTFHVNDVIRCYYFISGTLGHCELGQKVAVEVMPYNMNGSPQQSPGPHPTIPRQLRLKASQRDFISRLRGRRFTVHAA